MNNIEWNIKLIFTLLRIPNGSGQTGLKFIFKFNSTWITLYSNWPIGLYSNCSLIEQ